MLAGKAPPGKRSKSVTSGWPRVRVPVLSSTMVRSLPAVSRASALRKISPFSAPLPDATMIEVGVARPRAQGQAITSTLTRNSIASTALPLIRNHTTKAVIARAITTGTNQPTT